MADVVTITQMLESVQKNLPDLWRLVTGGSFLIGLFFALRSIYLFKEYGESRAMGGGGADIRRPLINLFIAAGLLYWPSLVNASLETLFKTNVLYSYHLEGSSEQFNKMVQILGNIVQFIGFIAFIRGWVLLSRIAQQGGAQPGGIGKAICHMIGGILALNIFATWKILQSFLGL